MLNFVNIQLSKGAMFQTYTVYINLFKKKIIFHASESHLFWIWLLFQMAEPVQFSGPRIKHADKFQHVTVNMEQATSLMAPIQSYPAPAYR